MSHQGKPSTSTAPTPDAAQFVSRGGKGGRGRGGGGGRGQSLNKQQQKTRQNPPGSGNGAQQGSKSTRPPAAGPAGGAAPAQNGKDGAAPKQQTQSYVPKVTLPATSSAVPQPAPAVAGAQQLPTPTTTPASAQPTPAQQGGATADGNAAAIQAPSPHAPQPRPPVAASGGQGPAPPFVGFTNGAGAPPAGGRGRGIPPRTQSAPPNLKEQKQAAIFIPARATPNPAAFPGAPYYPPPGAPYYPQPPPGVQPGVSPTHPYAPPGQGGVPPPRGAIYQPPTHGRSQVPPGPQGGPPQGGMGGPPPHAGQVGGPQMGPQQPMGPPSGYVPGHRLPPFVPGRGPYMPRGPAGMQPMGPPPHSMPIQIPQQKRRSSRIAIIDPQTGQEVNTSPPKDDLPGDSSGSAGTSPYQHSPPSSGLRPTGGIMGHPYAPGGSSPSRQAPPFKPDMGAADFSDSEQFAPNHPYAPGRSAAIPIIDKPSSSPIVITTPPQMRAAAAAAEQAKATAEEPAKDQTAAVADAAPVKEADKKEEKEEVKEKKEEEGASPLPEAATKEEEKQPEKKTDAEVEAKPAEVPPTKDEAKAEEVKAEPAAQEKDTTEEKEEKKAAAEEQPVKEAESQPTKEAEPTTKEEEAAAPTTEKAAEEPSKAAKQKPAAATEDGGKKASSDGKKTKSGSRKAVSSKKGDEGESKAAVVAPSADKKEDQPQEKKEAEEPAKKDEAEPQTEEKPAETEQDDDDWEVKAEKEDLVLQKDVSLRPTYAGSNAPGSFRPTINPQAEASWNGSGTKRTYDRDFLLKFQTYCRERPEGLPSVEVILGNEDKGKSGGGGGGRGGKGGRGGGMGSSGEWSRGAQQQFSGRGGRGGPGMPGMPFAPVPGKFGAPPGLAAPIARGPGGRGGPPGGPIRRGPKKIPGRETPPPGIMPPPEPVAPMADNPSVWKPSRRRGDDNEEIYGKVRSVLNKITGDKFGPLSQQMVDLLKSKATDVEILREIINIIFDKALAEPGFSTMYAELCRVLEKNCPTFETNKEGKPQTFKRILLNRCQEAFEHKPHDETVDNDPLKKEEADMKQKRRMIGNIVFIGELYKEHMLTDKIMHECVFRRLLGDIKNPVEADLEALCKLMNTIGKVLDVPKAKGYMDAYFKRMKSLTQNPNIPSRIRFLLLDVLDLRANRWTSSVTEKPVKSGGGRGGAPQQQHKPAPAPAGGRGAAYRPAGAGGPSHGPHGGPRGNAEGWETVGRGGHRGGGGDRGGGGGGGGGGGERGPPVTLSSGEVVLGPNQSRMGPTMGGTGAKGWRDVSKRPQDSRRDATPASRPGSGPAPAPAKGNIFAALSDISEKSPQAESRQAGRPASRDRSRSREGREPQPSPRGGDRAERAAEPLPSPRSRAEKEDEAVVGPLDPETEKSIKLLLEEFLDTQDEDEARQCVDDIDATGFQPHLVKAIIVMATEKKEVVREMLLQLITHFTKKSTITAPQFVAGLRLVLEQLDDIKLDAPLAPKVVGQFMGSALLDNYLEASFVMPALEPLVESGSAISVLVGLFNFYIENTSIGETRDFVKEAGWDITSMFKTSSRNATSISEWLQVNNLDTVFPVAWAHGKLQAMLASGDDAEKILQWIDENVSKEASRDEEFAQRLTRLFLDFVAARTKSISEQDKVVEEETKLFEQYAPLLKKFLSDSQAQVDCLSVVQRFCFEQDFPEGLLERLFQELNDAEVVDEEAFREWAADKQDSFGKSQALAQLANWLSVLA